jgi:hypothetical protein
MEWVLTSGSEVEIIRGCKLGFLLAKTKKAVFRGGWRGLSRKFRMLSSGSAGSVFGQVGGVSKVHIWSPPHTLFLASQLVESLKEMGIKSRIVDREFVGLRRADLEIILAPVFFGLPLTRGPRIVFQLEQTTSTRWWTPEYVSYMNSALAVFEYSQFNVEKLIQYGVDSQKIYHVPLGGSTKVFSQSIISRAKALTRDKRIMAYGWFTGSPRRERFIMYATEQMPSLIVHTDVFGEEMAKELESSHVVVHINYYTPAILATPRLWESLSRGCQVVSEKAMNWREDPYLLKLVRFVNEDEFDLVRDYANELSTVELETQDRLTTIEGSELRFRIMLARGMFGVGLINEISTGLYQKST